MPISNHSQTEEESFSSGAFNLRGIFHTLIDKAWLIALCIAAAGFLTALAVKHAPKTYAAKVVIQVEQDKPKIVNIEDVQNENFNTVDFLKTIEHTLQSRSLFERVLETQNLASDPRFVAQANPKPSKATLISWLADMIEVRLRPGTRLIDITVEHSNPELTALVANSLVDAFIEQNKQQQSTASQEASDSLKKEAERLAFKLQRSHEALQVFKETNKFLPSENQQNTIVQRLKEKLTELKSERIRLSAEYSQFLGSKRDVPVLLAIPFVAKDQTVIQIQNNISTLLGEIATLEKRYLEKHPRMINARSQLAQWQKALSGAISNLGETLKTTLENTQTAENAIQESLAKEEEAAIGLSRMAAQYSALEREAQSDQALYQMFLNRMKETAVMKDLDVSKVRVIQSAHIPEAPVKPQKPRMILIGISLGALIGICLALTLGALDTSLKSLDEAEDYLRLRALSTVPQIRSSQLDPTQLVMSKNGALSGAESFRSLRTSLSLLQTKGEHKVCMFTSALPEEGKTFCSLNYACSLAQQGLRVLLIDCDLRRPAVERCLCASHGKLAGLSDILNGQRALKDVVYETGIANYFFVPAGTPVPNPSELLAQKKFDALLQEALNHFDRIVLDSAPIFGVSDTLLMANRVDAACLVIRAYKTPRKKVLRAVHILQSAGQPLAGVVLNRVPPHDRRNGDDPYYDYGYAAEKSQNIVPLARAS